MADRVGQLLGNYRLTHLIGRGGFAEVYLGEHVRLSTQAAVKVLHTRILESEEVEHFQQEARTIALLEHPHIVRVLDFDVREGTPFLIMGYAPHGNLRQRHPKGTILPVSTVVDYIKQVSEALQYAHDHKLIHRDIKPENMLIGRRDEILLSDFGIALLAQSSRLQSTHEVAGTASYMAPEQLQGKPRLASDQYALGIVVYEWLCGKRPFEGSFTEIASQHVLTPPPLLSERVPAILPEIEQVVLMALAKDPRQRFASVRAFATALEQACQVKPSFLAVPFPEAMQKHDLLPPSDEGSTNSPSNPQLLTNMLTPPSESSSLQTESVTGQQPQQAPFITTSSKVPVALPPPSPSELPPPNELYPSPPRITRRAVVVGLAGLVVVGGGITTWLVLSQGSQGISPAASSTASPTTRTSPSATQPPSPTIAPVAFKAGGISFIWPREER